MKFLVVLAVAVACAAAADVAEDEQAPILKSNYETPYVITEDQQAPILKSKYETPYVITKDQQAPFLKSKYETPYVITEDHLAPILKSSYESSPEGNFVYSYETGNRINAYAEGVLKSYNSESPVVEIRGSYKYYAPDGTPIETSYVADKDGFLATGAHIPVAPPIPEAILRGLAYTAAHTPVVAEKPYYSENSYKA